MNSLLEAIKVLEYRHNFFPAKFYWRGKVHQIDAVNECRTETTPGSSDARFHYWVRSDGQLFHLSELASSGAWVLYAE